MMYSTKTFRTTFWLMIAVQAIIIGYSFFMEDSTTTSLQTMARLSGRLSLALFSSLVVLHLRDDSYKGMFLIFAVAHGIHMVELIAYQNAIGNISSLMSLRVAGGMLAYAFIYAMPVIQYNSVKFKLNAGSLVRIEYVYLAFIWVSFVMAYIPRLFSTKVYGGSYIEFVVLFAWLVALFLWKVYYTFSEHARKPSNA